MNKLVKRNLFNDLFSLENNFDKLFSFDNFLDLGNWFPEMDVYETDREVIIEAECAGISPEDVKVTVDNTVDNGVLTITGEKKNNHEEKRGSYHRIERSYGTFTRSFALPTSVDADNIEAEIQNGVLRVKALKTETPSTKEIEVKSDSQPKSLSANNSS